MNLGDLHPKHSDEDVRKTLAFQIGQCLGVMNGKRLFTKQAVIEAYPKLKSYIERESDPCLMDLYSMQVDLLMLIATQYEERIYDLKEM
jgi:hypothetical protein